MKLRSHLVLLVLATIVLVVLFAAVLVVYNARLQRESVERGMVAHLAGRTRPL